jgi:hypothetical protein
MASPFRFNKKERRRSRKFVKSILSGNSDLETNNPEAAASFRRIAESATRMSLSKRRKKKS